MSELLLIDDDEELCELLVSWLSQEGFQVHACHDGNSARAALARHAPSAVVLDVMLPDGSGLELLRQLRGNHPDLPEGELANGWGFRLDERGQNTRAAPVLMQWRQGRPVAVWPEVAAFSPP